MWEQHYCRELYTFDEHLKRITSLVLSPDRTHFLSVSDDRFVKLWKLPIATPRNSLGSCIKSEFGKYSVILYLTINFLTTALLSENATYMRHFFELYVGNAKEFTVVPSTDQEKVWCAHIWCTKGYTCLSTYSGRPCIDTYGCSSLSM